MSGEYLLTGATVVAVKYSGGVVLGAEKRVTLGMRLMSRSGKKIYQISENLYIGVAGLIADMQAISRNLKAELKLYELESKRPPTVKVAAKLLSNMLYSHKIYPYFASVIVVGVDESGPHIYVLDPLGSVIEDNYVALGSGSELAISIVETEYSKELDRKHAEELIIKSIKAASQRDVLSGDGIDIVVIEKGVTEQKFIPLKTL